MIVKILLCFIEPIAAIYKNVQFCLDCSDVVSDRKDLSAYYFLFSTLGAFFFILLGAITYFFRVAFNLEKALKDEITEKKG